ncbi:MAG TPA: response regulator [Tepidisphaeraceae bacterium]|nr:response regulator [Tepidisphaeraceae bacterium]
MSYNILIVDDSATTRAMIKRTIRMTNLPIGQLYESPNGKIALELLATTPVDLILADLNMPEMDGFEMTRRIRSNDATKNIPVIVVSASPNAEDFARVEHASGCITKPFTPEGIRQSIERALEVQHA